MGMRKHLKVLTKHIKTFINEDYRKQIQHIETIKFVLKELRLQERELKQRIASATCNENAVKIPKWTKTMLMVHEQRKKGVKELRKVRRIL